MYRCQRGITISQGSQRGVIGNSAGKKPVSNLLLFTLSQNKCYIKSLQNVPSLCYFNFFRRISSLEKTLVANDNGTSVRQCMR